MKPAMSSGSGSGRRMTIRSISCRGVRAFVPFQKPPLYAAVSLGGRREKTPPDAGGCENPDWDAAVFAFDLDGDQDGAQQQPAVVVEFEVKAQVPILGNKLVGTASVPVADLAAAASTGGGGGGRAGAGDDVGLRHVSYQVCAPDGKPNGTLTFAYAITGGAGVRPQPPQLYPARPGQNPSFCCAPPSSAAYPPPPPAAAAANFPPPPPQPPQPASSASLYPPLQGLLSPPPRRYPPPPPPPPPYPQFPAPNNSSYPPPPSTNYPPPPPPSGYPPPPPPASNWTPPTTGGAYPPPPESGSAYPVYPRSAPGTVDRALPYYPAPPGGSYYPRPGTWHPEVDGAARTPSFHPPPGTWSRYP